MCFDRGAWVVIPIALLLFLLQSFLTDYSIIKIELLYCIYRKDDIYCSVLHDIFLGKYSDFLDKLKLLTKKQVTGYVFKSGGKFYGKYFAVCRDKSNKIMLTFKKNEVVVTVNDKKTVINSVISTRDQLLSKIATAINGKGLSSLVRILRLEENPKMDLWKFEKSQPRRNQNHAAGTPCVHTISLCLLPLP